MLWMEIRFGTVIKCVGLVIELHCIQSIVKVVFVLQVAGDVGKIQHVKKVLMAENEVFRGLLPGTRLLFYNQ